MMNVLNNVIKSDQNNSQKYLTLLAASWDPQSMYSPFFIDDCY